MSFPDVEKIVADYLVDEGFENVFRGSEKEPSEFIPSDSIFVLLFSNPRPQSFLSGGKGPQIHTPEVQVMIRSAPYEEEVSKTMVLDAYDALRDSQPTGVDFIKVGSGPLRLGADSNGVYRWTINLEVSLTA